MAHDPNPPKGVKARTQEQDRKSAIKEYVGRPLARLADGFFAFKDQAKSDAETKDTDQRKQRFWLIFSSIAGSVLSLATLGVIVFQTTIFNRQTVIDANQRTDNQAVQRAYVADDGFRRILGIQGQQTTEWGFVANWKNSGPTWTKNMTQHIGMAQFPVPKGADVLNLPFPRRDDFADQPQGVIARTIVVPAGAVRRGTILGIPAADIKLVWERQETYYFYGWARYHDIFEGTPEHLTRFCYQLLIDGDPSVPSTSGADFIPCPQGNCADEECKKQGWP